MIKNFTEFIAESAYFDKYQGLKNLMYQINEYGKYKIKKENWFIYDEKNNRIGSYYMFLNENKVLIIDKIIFNDITDVKEKKVDHFKLFLEQLTKFCAQNKVIAAVSPDRIIDRKTRKSVKDEYLKNGFVPNSGKNVCPIVTETMYRPL